MSSSYRSRFAGHIVDAHCHVDAAARPHFERLAAGSQAVGFLNLWDASWPPPAFAPWRESMRAFAPRMQLCHMPDLSAVGAPGFERGLVEGIRAAAAAGAAGVKMWKNLGLWLEDVDGRRPTLLDARLEPLWETAAEVGLPIVIHVGDPPEFFAPLDAANRRREELEQHPDWWFGREGFPSLAELLGQFERLVAVHPRTVFVAAHFGCFLEPGEVARMLASYPNYLVDTSVRLLNLADTRARAGACRDVILAHPERVIFGTDFIRTDFWDLPSANLYGGDRGDLDAFYAAHWRVLETADEVELPYPFAMAGDVAHGLDLPDDVLEQVYAANARRVYRGAWPERGDATNLALCD